jgi:hypothetical protein
MTVWYAGLDLGKVRDETSFAVLEETRGKRPCVTLLKTWRPERDDCLDVLPEILRLVDRDRPDEVLLGIDGRGVYRDVVEVALSGPISLRCSVFPLLPSHSDRSHRQLEDGFIWVGKKALFRAVLRAVDAEELPLAPGLAEAEAFLRDLEGLRVIPTKGGTSWTYSHADQSKGSHDDRISAVANALFLYRYARPETPAIERVRPANRPQES